MNDKVISKQERKAKLTRTELEADIVNKQNLLLKAKSNMTKLQTNIGGAYNKEEVVSTLSRIIIKLTNELQTSCDKYDDFINKNSKHFENPVTSSEIKINTEDVYTGKIQLMPGYKATSQAFEQMTNAAVQRRTDQPTTAEQKQKDEINLSKRLKKLGRPS